MKVAVWFVLLLLILAAIGYLPKASSKIMAVKLVAALKTTEEPDQDHNFVDEPIISQKPYHKIEKKETTRKIKSNNDEYLADKIEVKRP